MDNSLVAVLIPVIKHNPVLVLFIQAKKVAINLVLVWYNQAQVCNLEQAYNQV